ncbi:MAG: hypothetical protein Kow00121_10770 [Elainellaceae cyanobacterium]
MSDDVEVLMFRTEDYVLHRMFRYSGMVIGYGRRLVNGNYVPTLKVRLVNHALNRRKIVVEDVTSHWVRRANVCQTNQEVAQH